MSADAITGPAHWLVDGANWSGENGITHRLVEHVGISALSVGICCLVALPVALWLGHTGRGGALAINVSNVGRAVPTFALLTLLYLVSDGIDIGGWTPSVTFLTVVALVLFGIPPLLTNTYVGMREVDRGILEAARGMGMSGRQALLRVELPLATPLLLAGLRLCAVQVVATATIAALIAGPGLGDIVTQGFGLQDYDEVVGGAVCVAVLALVVDLGLAGVARVGRRNRPAGG